MVASRSTEARWGHLMVGVLELVTTVMEELGGDHQCGRKL